VLLCDRTDGRVPVLRWSYRSASVDSGEDIEPLLDGTIRRSGEHVKGETQMTRMRRLLARAVVLALLLLTVGGGIARADDGSSMFGTATLPDDPGYDLTQ